MANLTQLKMLEDLNGFLLVDKPAGIAFSTVVKTVKRKFNLVKVGHGGSLVDGPLLGFLKTYSTPLEPRALCLPRLRRRTVQEL